MSMFLSSINMVRGRVYQALEGVANNEAERRHAFDALIQIFWPGSNDNTGTPDAYLSVPAVIFHLTHSDQHLQH